MTPITISYLTGHIKTLLETDDLARDVWVTGESEQLESTAASGHIYFTLKDSGATINAVMWRNSTVQHVAAVRKRPDSRTATGIYPSLKRVSTLRQPHPTSQARSNSNSRRSRRGSAQPDSC
ncbi:MAG: exodeoxyribonuclease VII large subunit [Caldilineaceae bacterium]